MSPAKIYPEKLHLLNIDIVDSIIRDLPNKVVSQFNIKVAHDIMHNLNDKRIKIGLLIDLQSKLSNKNKASAHFDFDFHFQIDDFEKHFELDKNKNPIFSGLLITTLIGISFSTARGIIYERLSKTNMQGIILPVVSPAKLLKTKTKE